MACQTNHSWTLIGLVCAFLDLGIAYFLLCASILAFMASKFLGFLGLGLPCPCKGLFGYENRNYCLQRLLLDCPIDKVSNVQFSVKNKFPFNLNRAQDQNYQLNFKLIGERNNSISGFTEIEDTQKSQRLVGNEMGYEVKRRFDFKGKGVMNERPRSSLRRRRKGIQGSPPPLRFNEEEMIRDDREAHVSMELEERASQDFKSDKPLNESIPTEKDLSSSEEYSSSSSTDIRPEPRFDVDEKNVIRVFEQALEGEHLARDALYLELERERSAAASAADEAMAMIFRLQEEKASIEMETRQYRRMTEEKSAYDTEEMNILKEIIVRREREKHFLEKELEAYRQITYIGNERLEVGSIDPRQDPVLMVHQLDDGSGNYQKTLATGKALPIQEWDESNMEFQEKGVVSVDANCLQREGKMVESSTAQEHNHGNETHIQTETNISILGENSGKHGKEQENKYLHSSMLDTETSIHDVHVIDDVSDMCCKSDSPSESSEIQKKKDVCDSPSTSEIVAEPNSDRNNGSNKTFLSGFRGNSISVVGNVKLMIESEVGCLREKLKIVQEEREKLNFSVEHRESGKVQLQLLEDLARQLREIRELTEPGKAARQASLPPPSTKVTSKKRRSRSASLGVHISS